MSPHKTNCSTHCTPNLQMAAKWACWGQFGRFLVLWTHLIKPDTMDMPRVKIGFEKGPFGDPKCVINGATQGGPEGCQMVGRGELRGCASGPRTTHNAPNGPKFSRMAIGGSQGVHMPRGNECPQVVSAPQASKVSRPPYK